MRDLVIKLNTTTVNRIVLFLLAFLSFNAKAVDNNISTFQKANELYKKGQFDTAAVLYEKILKSGYESPEVYFNLGNAYYRQKNIAKAILNYERASKLDPNNEEISFNLQLAQTMIVDKISPLPDFFLKKWWKTFSEIFSSNGWAVLSMVLFVITLILTGIYLFTTIVWVKKTSFWTAGIVLFLTVVSMINSYETKVERINKKDAIVLTPSVTVKSSPDENGTDIFVIHEGTKVRKVDEVDSWVKIVIADGTKGWVKITDIEPI
jgi:tetratricopeptide (TPR) repeat protein